MRQLSFVFADPPTEAAAPPAAPVASVESIEPHAASLFRLARVRDPAFERRVGELFIAAAQERRVRQIRRAKVSFRPFRSTLYSFRIAADGQAMLRFHLVFRLAGEAVITQACHLMLARTRRSKAGVERRAYDAFIAGLPPQVFRLPGVRRPAPRARSGPGRFRSLDESFDRINRSYFEGQLARPKLCWSPKRSRRILGSYTPEDDRLIVSRVFDAEHVPLFVLDYLMYHELLHKYLGIGRRQDGKRCMHGARFRALEKRFDRFEEAQTFLEAQRF